MFFIRLVFISYHTTCHLHGIASHGLGEIFVNHIFVCAIADIRVNSSPRTEFEVRVFRIVNVFLESLILIQVSIILIIRFA